MLSTTFRHALVACCFISLAGCFGGSDPVEDPNATGLGATGDYDICSYESGLDDAGYASARVSYPCDTTGLLPATTLTGGFTNTKEQMYWLADHLTTHGFVVITMTPTNALSTPPTWSNAQRAGFAKLETEHFRTDSPIYSRVDLAKRNLMGFSMGGGGVLLADTTIDDNASAIALAPWLGGFEDDVAFAAMDTPVFILGSENDELAYASNVTRYYNSLPESLTRGLGLFADYGHFEWYGDGDEEAKTQFRTIVTALLNVYLKDDFASEDYLNGDKHNDHMANNWYASYEYLP